MPIPELLDLVAYFGQFPLFVAHPAWRDHSLQITHKLLIAIQPIDGAGHSDQSDEASAAFLLLPGILEVLRTFKLGKPIEALKAWSGMAGPPARSIIARALELQSKVREIRDASCFRSDRAQTSEDKHTRAIQRKKKVIEKLVYNGRLSAALTQTTRLNELLCQTQPPVNAPVTASTATAAATFDLPTPRDNPVLSTDQAARLLRHYNPRARPAFDDLSPWIPAIPPPLVLKSDTVLEALNSANSGAAAGYSPWTYAFMKFLLRGEGNAALAEAVTRLFNLMLANRVRREWWVPSRAALFPKGETAWRPLGIGESWYRLLGRAVMKAIGEDVGKVLAPIQLGAGIPGGSEIAGRLAQVMLSSQADMIVVNLDLANAFNTIPRDLMWRGVCEFSPSLCHWFQWAYGAPTELRLRDGHVACLSETGSRQGDPLAALIFCLGFQYPLREIAHELRVYSANLPEPIRAEESIADRIARDDVRMQLGRIYATDPERRLPDHTPDREPMSPADLAQYAQARYLNPDSCGLVAYMDDCNVFVPEVMLPTIAPFIVDTMNRYGMTLNVSKCQALYSTPPPPVASGGPTHAGPFPIQRNGTTSMGVPTGPLDNRLETTRRLLKGMEVPLACLTHLSSLASFAIVRQCLNARAGYLARVTEAPETRDLFREFDSHIDQALQVILEHNLGTPSRLLELVANRSAAERFLTTLPGQPPDPPDPGGAGQPFDRHEWMMTHVLPRLRGLPLHYGGLGVTRYGGVAGDKACLRSRAITSRFVDNHYSLAILQRGIQRWPPIHIGSGEEALGFVDPFTEAADEADPTVNERTSDSVFKNIQLRLLADLTQHHMDAERAWLLSAAYGGSGKWLLSASASGKYYGPYRFRPEEFLEALRLRCLLHPLPHNPNAGDPCTCVCGKDITHELTHPLDCIRMCAGFLTLRHNLVRDALAGELKRLDKFSHAGAVRVEVPLSNQPDHPRTADVVLQAVDANQPQFLDVTVTDPAAPRYREAGNSHMVAGAASKHRAEEKIVKYRRLNLTVIPIALEATGRPSDDTHEYLLNMSRTTKTRFRSRFLALSGVVIQRQNARAILHLRSLRTEHRHALPIPRHLQA